MRNTNTKPDERSEIIALDLAPKVCWRTMSEPASFDSTSRTSASRHCLRHVCEAAGHRGAAVGSLTSPTSLPAAVFSNAFRQAPKSNITKN
jgi:hypothetical protein